MKRAKRKAPIAPIIGHRVAKTYVNCDGVKCVDVEYTDGKKMTFKISHPSEPFFRQLRKGLENIPRLNMDEAVSELRD